MNLIRSKRVIPIAEEQPFGDDVLFEQRDEEYTSLVLCQFILTTHDWEDMGSPDTVTVTVEPGDTLNIPGETVESDYVVGSTTVPHE